MIAGRSRFNQASQRVSRETFWQGFNVQLPPGKHGEPEHSRGVPRVLLQGAHVAFQVAGSQLRVIGDPTSLPLPRQRLLRGLLGGQGENVVAYVHPDHVPVDPARTAARRRALCTWQFQMRLAIDACVKGVWFASRRLWRTYGGNARTILQVRTGKPPGVNHNPPLSESDRCGLVVGT